MGSKSDFARTLIVIVFLRAPEVRESALFRFLDWSPVAVVAACVIAGLGPALLLTWVVSRLPARWRASLSSSTNASTVGTVSLLFGLFAAFLANDIWVRNQVAQQAVIEEGDAIRNLARLSEGQDEQHRLELRNALVDYANIVIEKDWPLMVEGKRSLEVLARVPQDFQSVGFRPGRPQCSAVRSQNARCVRAHAREATSACNPRRKSRLHHKMARNGDVRQYSPNSLSPSLISTGQNPCYWRNWFSASRFRPALQFFC